MKKNIQLILLLLAGMLGASCSNENFADKFADPSMTSTARVDRLMTGVFEKGNQYSMPWYYRYFTFENQQIARYAQTLGWINSSGMYLGSDSYNDDRWKKFYEMLAQFRALQNQNNSLSAVEQKTNEVFIVAANIFLYDHLQQIVDLWGDAPFKTAGYLGVTGDIVTSEAAFDKAEDLYTMMLDDLERFDITLANLSIGQAANSFKNQDYINAGDIMAWRRYCNSLRLRIAARAADHGSLINKCRLTVKTILSDPSKFPVIESNDQNILIKNQPPDLQAIEDVSGDGIKQGFETWGGLLNRASKAMVDRLENDPRSEIILDKNHEGNYEGIDPLMVSTQQERLFQRPEKEGGNFFSAVDSATFSRNNFFPGVLITAAEVSFIKAEACQRWGVPGDAGSAFKKGVQQSIEFYFYLNSVSKFRAPVTPPSVAEINDFVNKLWDNEPNKDKLISTQKWIHYGNILSVQAWSEIRKTGYPELEFTKDISSTICPLPPYRLKYTLSERNYNMRSYAKVQEQDGFYVKLFWAKPE